MYKKNTFTESYVGSCFTENYGKKNDVGGTPKGILPLVQSVSRTISVRKIPGDKNRSAGNALHTVKYQRGEEKPDG